MRGDAPGFLPRTPRSTGGMNTSPARPVFLSRWAEEPFRIFFPFGVLAGVSGVSLWPLYFTGIHTSFYPGVMHARLMIEGFVMAFAIGFLGTAAPRWLGTPTLSRSALSALLGLYAAVAGLHLAHRHSAGDAFFLALLLVLLWAMGRRARAPVDLPPPGLALVAIGFFQALGGAALLLAGGWGRRPPAVLSSRKLDAQSRLRPLPRARRRQSLVVARGIPTADGLAGLEESGARRGSRWCASAPEFRRGGVLRLAARGGLGSCGSERSRLFWHGRFSIIQPRRCPARWRAACGSCRDWPRWGFCWPSCGPHSASPGCT